jgi:hypothetical protein
MIYLGYSFSFCQDSEHLRFHIEPSLKTDRNFERAQEIISSASKNLIRTENTAAKIKSMPQLIAFARVGRTCSIQKSNM